MTYCFNPMNARQFQSDAPGRLVRTVGYEPMLRGGVPENVAVESLAFVPNPLPPSLSDSERGRLLDDVVAAQTELIRLEGLLIRMPDPNILLGPMQKREASYSAKIENTTASVREIAIAEADQPPPRPEVLEVRNHLHAFQHGIRSKLPLSLRLMREMHEILLSGVDERKQPGKFRPGQVHIHGTQRGLAHARFVPPPSGKELNGCLDAFERYLNRDRGQWLSLPIDLAMAHYQFECIHPFMDGNGRIGRLLIPLLGLKRGQMKLALPNVSRFLEHNRGEYCDHLLRVSTHGEWVPWIRFFCRAIVDDCRADEERAVQLVHLLRKYRELVTSKRTSILMGRLVDLLFIRPAVTTSIVCRELGVTAPAAQKHIDRLARAGIIREITGNNYGRVWLAEELVRAIEVGD